MQNYLNIFQTGYAITRCALSYGVTYLPHYGHKVSQVARQALFGCDVLSALYAGWQIKQQEEKYISEKTQYYVDLAVKSVALLVLATFFVKVSNRVMTPKLNPIDLLSYTKIPKEVIQFTARESMNNIKVTWNKGLLDNLFTGLFFTHTVLDLYLAHLKKERLPLFRGLLHAGLAFKTSQYRTLAIRHRFSSLFNDIRCTYGVSGNYPELYKFFAVPVKKVDAIFYLNVEGKSENDLIKNIQSIYDYSLDMFQNSHWVRYWNSAKGWKEYFDHIINPIDQGLRAFHDSMSRYWLFYDVSIRVIQPPPAPVEVRVLHEDEIWQSFKGIDILQWIPLFLIPGQRAPYSSWVTANLRLPETRADHYVTKVLNFLSQ